MKSKIAIAGNEGKKVRSDCRIKLELDKSNGIDINLSSKVADLYGDKIREKITEVLNFFGIEKAKVEVIDTGALDYILEARIEAAVKQLIDTDKEYLPEFNPENNYKTEADRFRFTRLYLPGNKPAMMLNAGLHSPDGIILDLEDSVAPAKKEEARLLVRNTLRVLNFYGAERMVRINQGDRGIEDLKYVIPHNVNLILVPKAESPDYLKKVSEEIKKIEHENPVYLMPIIESAMGIEKAFEIATATPEVVALAIGLEDFTADLGTERTKEGKESQYARYKLVNAAKAARIQPIDSVFSDVEDTEGLKQNVRNSKNLGFEGMGCIHPRQIPVIQECFIPQEEELDKAIKIADAYYAAEEQGLGVVSLGSKMIDPPVVKRALKTIELAISFNLISKNWRKEYVR